MHPTPHAAERVLNAPNLRVQNVLGPGSTTLDRSRQSEIPQVPPVRAKQLSSCLSVTPPRPATSRSVRNLTGALSRRSPSPAFDRRNCKSPSRLAECPKVLGPQVVPKVERRSLRVASHGISTFGAPPDSDAPARQSSAGCRMPLPSGAGMRRQSAFAARDR